MTSRKLSSQELGAWGENKAKEYLLQAGFEILDQNVRTEYGEIDLVVHKEDRLHFVEVKTRRTKEFGFPEESIGPAKVRHLTESAQAYLQAHPDLEPDWQVDVVAIIVHSSNTKFELRVIPNAI